MASLRNRYSKSLEGLNAVGFVSPAVAYTAATTYAAFAALSSNPALNGQLAIINAVTNAVRTTALAVGDKFFIAQLVDGAVKKTPVMVFGEANNTRVRKTVYNAPVKQRTIVGYNGTSGSLGVVAPTPPDTNTYVLSVRDTSPSTQPFPIQEGRITATKAGTSVFDLTAALVYDLVNAPDYEKNSDVSFIRAQIITNGTPAAIATVTATFNEGSTTVTFSGAHTAVVGDIIVIAALGWTYKVVAVNSSTVLQLDRPYAGPSVTTAAGGVSKVTAITATGISLEAIVEDTTFVVSLGGELSGATVTFTTPWKQGAGAPFQVAAMEDQTQVMDGYTTLNAQWPQDYGQPTKFVGNPETSTLTYNQYVIQAYNKTESMAYPNENTASQSNVIIACPVGGTTPDATISLVLTGA